MAVIGVLIVAAGAVAWRIRKRLFTRAEASFLSHVLEEVPDYLVDEEPIDFDVEELQGLRFERLETLDVGSRRFAIYRRLGERETR